MCYNRANSIIYGGGAEILTEQLCKSAEDTERFAEEFAKQIVPGDVIALFGGLGMGKTTFVRGLARGLYARQEDVSSPTFALVHEYEGRLPIYHFDMYRVHTLDDLYSTGFFDYLESFGVVVVEWSENIVDYLPKTRYNIHIEPGSNENERWLRADI